MARRPRKKKPNKSVSYRQNSYRAVAQPPQRRAKGAVQRLSRRKSETSSAGRIFQSPLGDHRGVKPHRGFARAAGPRAVSTRSQNAQNKPVKQQTMLLTRKNGWIPAKRAAMDRFCTKRPDPKKAGQASAAVRAGKQKKKTSKQRNKQFRSWC